MKEWWAKLKEYELKMKEWWSTLSLREKQAAAVGGSLLGIFIVYQFMWTPLLNHVASIRTRIVAEQKTLVWMQAADKQLQKIEKASHVNKKSISPVVLLGILQKQINQKGVAQQLTQLKQASNSTVEMHFQKVAFDKLMTLLTAIVKEQNVSITQLSALADNSPGVVNADIMLKIES